MNTYSKKIDKNKSQELKELFINDKAEFDVVQYSVWRAKTKEYQAIYYTSSKLLIQGKNVDKIAKQVDNLISDTDINKIQEDKTQISFSENYIGTDESGKGDFFGPLVIASVMADDLNKEYFINLGVKDSKKLDDKKIIELAAKIKANAIHSVVVIMPEKYNELYKKFNNLNKLLAWGHARAIENILEKVPCKMAIADKFGDESLIQNALMKKGKNITLKQMVRAETDIIVASASVLARAEFVKRMIALENKYELKFSKGASSKVKDEAKDFINKYNFERLNEVAKLHFKTTSEL